MAMETRHNGTLLVVDDDPDFRSQLALHGAALGFRVLEAAGAAQAQELAGRERVDLALVDLMMEEMDSGFVLAHRLKAMRPGMPVVLVTGVARDTGLQFAANGPGSGPWLAADAVLAKPVRRAQLEREISRLMPSHTGAGGHDGETESPGCG